MKRIWIIAAYLLLVTQVSWSKPNVASRMNPLLRFVASIEGAKEFALYTIIANRCSRYMSEANKRPCYDAVRAKIDILDFDVLFNKETGAPILYNKADAQSYIFIAFKKNFYGLLNEQSTTVLLDKMQQELSRFLVGERANVTSLWDIAVSHYGREDKAAMAMAALFQDISLARLHLAYINQTGTRGSETFEENRSLLGRVIETVNFVLDNSEINFQKMFYPKNIRTTLNRNIYHYYVPLYLAQELERRGVSKRFSLIAPMFLTLSYEFVTTRSDWTYILNDPERIDPATSIGFWKLKDIYGGYSGANEGIKTNHLMYSFDDVGRAFGQSTRTGVALLFNNR